MSLVLQAIEVFARSKPEQPALSSQEHNVSYAELYDSVNNLAERLADYAGQCAGIDMDNGIDWVILDLACIKAGIVTVPLPPFFTASQRRHALHSSGAGLLFCDKPGTDSTRLEQHVIFLDDITVETTKVALADGTSKVTFTSGTTGRPKGVCLSQAGMEQVAGSLLQVIGTAAARKTAAILPMAVLLENVAGCYTTLMAGGCYDIQPQDAIGFGNGMIPDFVQLLAYLKDSRASSCILVPELLRGLMQAVARTQTTLPDMNFMAVGGARVSPALLQQAVQLGLPVFQGYGLSEAASVVALNLSTDASADSVGKVLPHVSVSVSEDGEIVLDDAAFLGYVGEPVYKGAYPTGDLGYIDEQDNLYITGRKKNIIINAMGRNVSPEWPESELLAQPVIAQAMVYDGGAAGLSAFVVPVPETVSKTLIAEAVDRANQALPEYAQVNNWKLCRPFLVSNQQLTGTGRPRRDRILAMAMDSEIHEDNQVRM